MEMSKRPRRVPTWFDGIGRYRVAAIFLFIPFLVVMLAMVTGMNLDTVFPLIARRAVYWTGLFILAVALAMDAWEVYSGKREVKRMIEAKIKADTPD